MPNLNADSSAVTARFKLSFQGADQIADFLVVNVEIAITRYTELVTTINIKPREQAFDVHAND